MVAIAMSEDGKAARHTTRHSVAMYIGHRTHIAKASGVYEETIQQIHDTKSGWPPRTVGIEDAMVLVEDQTVDQLCAAGTPDMCLHRVQEYLDAGASCPVLCPLTPNIAEIIDAFAPGS